MHWTKDMPTKEGWYWFNCMENEYRPYIVEVFLRGKYLLVRDIIGTLPVEDYHNGLTDSKWSSEPIPMPEERQ